MLEFLTPLSPESIGHRRRRNDPRTRRPHALRSHLEHRGDRSEWPTGNRYGDAAGHSCIAVAGPVERSVTVETGSADRIANMRTFSTAALNLLIESMSSS